MYHPGPKCTVRSGVRINKFYLLLVFKEDPTVCTFSVCPCVHLWQFWKQKTNDMITWYVRTLWKDERIIKKALKSFDCMVNFGFYYTYQWWETPCILWQCCQVLAGPGGWSTAGCRCRTWSACPLVHCQLSPRTSITSSASQSATV